MSRIKAGGKLQDGLEGHQGEGDTNLELVGIFHAQNTRPELWSPAVVAHWSLGIFKHC